MKNLKSFLVLLFLFVSISNYAQTVTELYNKKDFAELIKFADKTEDLTGEELYCVGYAFFQLEDDKNAVKMYNKAIKKGLDDDHIYLYKGLSLRYDKQYEKAIEAFKIAINRNPKGQKNYTELGNTFFFQKQYDSALYYFRIARELDFELGDPYYKIPHIYHFQADYEKALEEYKISRKLINKEAAVYKEILKEIGLLEKLISKDLDKSIEAYLEAVTLYPKDYELYPNLISAYNENENFSKADKLFAILKSEFEKENLPKEMQKFGRSALGAFDWKGQRVVVYEYFKDATETLDIKYKIYLINKDGQTVERTLMTEKTIQLSDDGPKHLLCEREKSGVHHTYPYGWNKDKIEYANLKKAVLLVLNKDINPSASSNYGVSKEKKKEKKRRRNK